MQVKSGLAQSCISDLKIIESVLRRVTRYILNCGIYVNRRPSYTSRHSILKSLQLSYWFECHDSIFILKCIKGKRLVWLSHWFLLRLEHGSDLRALLIFQCVLCIPFALICLGILFSTVSRLFGIIRLLLLDNNHQFLLSKLSCTSTTFWNSITTSILHVLGPGNRPALVVDPSTCLCPVDVWSRPTFHFLTYQLAEKEVLCSLFFSLLSFYPMYVVYICRAFFSCSSLIRRNLAWDHLSPLVVPSLSYYNSFVPVFLC